MKMQEFLEQSNHYLPILKPHLRWHYLVNYNLDIEDWFSLDEILEPELTYNHNMMIVNQKLVEIINEHPKELEENMGPELFEELIQDLIKIFETRRCLAFFA